MSPGTEKREPGVDTRKLYLALDQARRSRGMSWRGVASAAGVTPSMLSRLSAQRSPDTAGFAALVRWLGADANEYLGTTATEGTTARIEVGADVAALLKSRGDFSDEDVERIATIVRHVASMSSHQPGASNLDA